MKTRISSLLRYVPLAGVIIWAVAPQAVSAQTPAHISITRDGSQLTLSWDCVAGRSYQVFSITNLAASWEEVATEPKPLVAVGNRLSHSVSVALETRFYRVAELTEVTPPESDYMVIDLSGGASASIYPVNHMNSVPTGGWTDEYKTTKLVMRRIPAGTFTMGSPEGELGRLDNEAQRQVTMAKDYYMGVFEVTQRQWERVMGNWPSYSTNTVYRDSRPVEQVSYYVIRENPIDNAISPNWPQSSQVHVDSFMGKLRARTGLTTLDLPTEAQWERACRAGTTSALNSGKNLTNTGACPNMSEVGRYWDNRGLGSSHGASTAVGTAEVGSYLPNAWGLYDMHGNVREWCLDWYEGYHAPTADPVGADAGSDRVLRGGSCGSIARNCRSAYRSYFPPSYQFHTSGFRLSMTLP